MTSATVTADRIEIDRTNYAPMPDAQLPAVHQPQRPANAVANIAGAIANVMEEIGIIPKGGRNDFQRYDYARIEDILQRLTPLMGKHGLVLVPSEKTRSIFDNDAVVMATYSFTLIHKSGDVWPFPLEWTGISRARDSKGGFDDKALNKCATAAQKEFLKKLFQIPVGDDADAHDTSAQSYPPKQTSHAARAETKPVAAKPAAEPTQPPVNPDTGEVSPHAIMVTSKDGKFDWIKFGQQYLAALKSSKNADECCLWEDANLQNLATLAKQDGNVWSRLDKAVRENVGYVRPEPTKPATDITNSSTNEDII